MNSALPFDELSTPENYEIDEIYDGIIEEVEQIFQNILETDQASPEEIENFLSKLIPIIKNQTKIYVEELVSENDDQHFQIPDPYCNNSFYSQIPAIIHQNLAQKQPMMPTFINSNFQQLFLDPSHLNFAKLEKVKQSKTDKKSKKKDQEKSKKKYHKEEKESKIHGSSTVKSFNKLSLKDQQALISSLVKKSSKSDSNKSLSSLNKLLHYLLKFKPKSDSKCFTLSTSNDDDKVSKGIKSLNKIFISHFITDKFKGKVDLSSPNFTKLLNNFTMAIIELKYPSQHFQSMYDQLLRAQTKNVKICAFISGITKTDMKFREDKNIYSIVLDNTVTAVSGGDSGNRGSFNKCSSLTNITLSDTVTTIGSFSFGDCSSLIKIFIPNSVTFIGERCFLNCSNLTEINIPSSMSVLKSNLFYNCRSLAHIEIPNSIKEIEDFVFCDCKSLREIVVPSSVKKIGMHAFSGCDGLTEMTIPDSVTSVGSGLFFRSRNLREVRIPAAIKQTNFGLESRTTIIRT